MDIYYSCLDVKLARTLPVGDFDLDGFVDARDAGFLFAQWGSVPPGDVRADINRDRFVDAADAGVIFAEWTGDHTQSVPEPDWCVGCAGLIGMGMLAVAKRPK